MQRLPAVGGRFGKLTIGDRALQVGARLGELFGYFRRVEHREHLAGADMVADIGIPFGDIAARPRVDRRLVIGGRSEEHTSELQSLMRISYAVFCLKKKI